MRPGPTVAVATVMLLALTACGGDGDGPAAVPTVTETVTVTADPDDPPTAEPSPDDTATAPPATTDPCEDLEGGESLAFVFVASPTPGTTVTGGAVAVSGCANVFEATYQWQLLDREGAVLDEGTGTASCGSGCVGDLSFSATYSVSERQVGTLRVFTSSAQDGSEQDVNAIPLILEP